MDSEHRHELKENELAEFFRNFGQFWNKWGNSLLLVVLVVLVAVVAIQMVTGHRYREHEQTWESLEFEQSPAGLAAVAESVNDPHVRALAHLRAGDALLRTEPSLGAADELGVETSTLDTATRRRKLTEAAGHYEAVREATGVDPIYKVNALLGLAAVAEGLEQWELAGQRYDQVMAEAGEIDQPALAEHAQQRAKMLDRLREPMTLAPVVAAVPAVPAEVVPSVSDADTASDADTVMGDVVSDVVGDAASHAEPEAEPEAVSEAEPEAAADGEAVPPAPAQSAIPAPDSDSQP